MKLGIQISESSISKYLARHPKPPSQTWRTFLKNHAKQLVSVDFFTVPTVFFQVLFVFIVIQLDRRRLVHFNVTAHPTAEWTARQILEAFPFESAPKYLLRDRDGVYGEAFRQQVAVMNIKEVLQRADVTLAKGIRRACNRFDTERVFRPGDYLGRRKIVQLLVFICPLLSQKPSSSVAG